MNTTKSEGAQAHGGRVGPAAVAGVSPCCAGYLSDWRQAMKNAALLRAMWRKADANLRTKREKVDALWEGWWYVNDWARRMEGHVIDHGGLLLLVEPA